MYQKIINFVKYHNAFTIGLILAFVFSGAIFASEDLRDAVIGETIVTQSGVDNSALLAADLDNFDFGMTITGVSEDPEPSSSASYGAGPQNYYVDYTYQTLAIKDNVWQVISRQATLTVSKVALADQDLGLYVAEELGEIVDSELAYLKEVQQKEKEKGQTFVQETTKYTGLIGLVLNPVTKELPGYEPVVKPSEISEESIATSSSPETSQTTTPEETSEETGGIIFEESSTSCTPNWQCTDWQPLPEEILCGQDFTQTCKSWIDSNSCGTEEGKPTEGQPAKGKLSPQNSICSENFELSCLDGFSDCDNDMTNGCETQGNCLPNSSTGAGE